MYSPMSMFGMKNRHPMLRSLVHQTNVIRRPHLGLCTHEHDQMINNDEMGRSATGDSVKYTHEQQVINQYDEHRRVWDTTNGEFISCGVDVVYHSDAMPTESGMTQIIYYPEKQ